MKHTQLTKHGFIQAVKDTKIYKDIGNVAFQKLIIKPNLIDSFYENYRQACRYTINYLKQKPHLSSRDVKIIEEIINTEKYSSND